MDKTLLIFKALAGKANEAEKEELNNWLSESEANKSEYDDIKLLWQNQNEQQQDTPQYRDGLSKIKTLVHQKLKKQKQLKSKIASGILFLLSGILLLYFYLLPTPQKPNAYLSFNNATLEEIIKTIKNEYTIVIEVENPEVLTCKFTGTIFQKEDENQIVYALAGAMNLHCRMLGENTYRLDGDGCLSPHQ